MRDEAEAVIAAGALGRSDTYPALLRYLVERTATGQTPKELEIAIDVFERDTDFDVARDSLVRVYIHKLRQKLDAHYAAQPGGARLRLPRGRYQVVLDRADRDDPAGGDARPRRPWRAAAVAAAILVATVAAFVVGRHAPVAEPPTADAPVSAQSPLWAPILGSGEDVTLVLGDVFVFAELNRDFEVIREVRQFGIRGAEDLERYIDQLPASAPRRRALDSTWLSPGAVRGMERLLPLLRAGGGSVRTVLASELRDGLPSRGHTVFVGPLDTLGPLAEPTFTPSRFRLHPSAELLIDRETAEIHLREGLPERPYSERYLDFGLVSRRTAAHGGQVLVLAAVGDAAVVRLIDAVADETELERVDARLRAVGADPDGDLELLFEVASADDGLAVRLRHAGALPYVPTPRPLPQASGSAAQSASQ